MVLEEALTSPELGSIIQSFLYADELMVVFNLSQGLRQNFLDDICDIRFGLEILTILQHIRDREALQERAAERYAAHCRQLALRIEAYYDTDSESSSS